MPTYGYRASGEKKCETCNPGFEILQKMSEETLEKCPKCGAPVERVFFPPHISTKPSEKKILSDDNLRKHGFKKLVKEGDGKYRDALS
ncbi:MAG: FmdB family zinc ribbon protein [Planctomycetota bacterium]